MSDIIEILKKYWGHDSFRPFQKEIINDSINGKDVLALLPTGGGKSICFQIPGISRGGLTIVVSPLISLMQEQSDNLNKRGVKSKAITSGIPYRELDLILDNARFGGIDFLYTSPERIQSNLFIERFKSMPVQLIVVDEAHCISEWGHDFRPSFLNIKKLREIKKEVPIIALTATATEKVKEDIINQLQLNNVHIHEAPFKRDNLSYEVYKVENKLRYIIEYVKNHNHQCGIIYCQTRKDVKQIAKYLFGSNVKCQIYHGGMDKISRQDSLNNWLVKENSVMVATNAFGMGIDKPNVRYVLHYDFPQSLEAFFQEAGRAGRDGLLARAISFIEKDDFDKMTAKVHNQFPEIETIKLTYRALCNFLKIAIGSGKNESYSLDIVSLSNTFNLDILKIYNSLKVLEKNGNIHFSEQGNKRTSVKWIINNHDLYNFQLKHDSFVPMIRSLLKQTNSSYNEHTKLNEVKILKELKISQEQLISQIKKLEKYGLIEVYWQTKFPIITFLEERMPDDYLSIKPEAYDERKQKAIDKLEATLQFLNCNECRSKFIIRYFGQTSSKCNKCDICCKEKNENYEQAVLSILKDPLNFWSIQEKLKIEEFLLIEILDKLLADEKILLNNSEKYFKK